MPLTRLKNDRLFSKSQSVPLVGCKSNNYCIFFIRVTGYALAKIGKSAAFLLGVTAIGLQFVLSRKESAINWKKIEDEAREAFERASQQKQRSTLPPKLVTAFKQNQAFFGSFGGGFLIGISFS
uniref:FUN14 domain-containing protein 1 n=1 Tax=Mesocestoides corti TaxID=53468 RepID=A0A5K3F5C6_MESCO